MTIINAGIGYGVLLRPQDLTELKRQVLEEYDREDILAYAREGSVYDPENPLACVEHVEDLYARFVTYRYELLDFYGYGDGEEPTGYAVFPLYSQRLLSHSGEYEAPKLPYLDALQQIQDFQKEFCPDRTIGWKQWVMRT